MVLPSLCGIDGCRLLAGHRGSHSKFPTNAWGFFNDKDKKKLVKAGFATPRGGDKGAYQNHVKRSNKVIIPFERLGDVSLDLYKDGYIIRLFPDQYFDKPYIPKSEFQNPSNIVRIGENAFILYRSHEGLERFPPIQGWQVRGLRRDGEVAHRRGIYVEDIGHYILRIPRLGQNSERNDGHPQGIFAPEYTDEEMNYLCQCVLAWLTIQTFGSPYALTQASHLRAILHKEGLDDVRSYELKGVLRHGLCCCPLCMKFIRYQELHETISFENEDSLANAGEQVEGSTRSTIINLFHLSPLTYRSLMHKPSNIGWGHAICNTRLGQRRCYSLEEIIEMDLKVGIIRPEGIETFGWISEDNQMIRSPNGAVWIQLNGDALAELDEDSGHLDASIESENGR